MSEITKHDCQAASNWQDRITLAQHGSSAAIDRIIAIKIDSAAVSTPGTSMEGHVMALVGTKKMAEFALKVERSPRAEVWTAITWILTIIIPAVIAFVAAQTTTKLSARSKQNDEFRGYRFSQLQEITDFIENVRPIIGGQEFENKGKLIYDLLQGKRDMLSKIPESDVRKLMNACIANNVQKITSVLKRLFPEATQSL